MYCLSVVTIYCYCLLLLLFDVLYVGMYVVSLPLQYGQVPGQVQYTPQAGVAYQQQPGVTYQPMVTTVVPAQIPITNVPTTKMPIFSLITSFIVTMVFFYWLPGFICLIPAIILGVAVSFASIRHLVHTYVRTYV